MGRAQGKELQLLCWCWWRGGRARDDLVVGDRRRARCRIPEVKLPGSITHFTAGAPQVGKGTAEPSPALKGEILHLL